MRYRIKSTVVSFTFLVNNRTYQVQYLPIDRVVQIFRKEPGKPNLVKIYQNQIEILSLGDARLLLDACLTGSA